MDTIRLSVFSFYSNGIGDMKLKEHIEKFDEGFDEPSEESYGEAYDRMVKELIEMEEKLTSKHQHSSNPFSEKLFASVEQLESEIRDKDKIIESLKNESTELTNQVSNVEKEKSTISEELEQSRWLESKAVIETKKVY